MTTGWIVSTTVFVKVRPGRVTVTIMGQPLLGATGVGFDISYTGKEERPLGYAGIAALDAAGL